MNKTLKFIRMAGILTMILMLFAAFSVPQVDAAENWKQVTVRFPVTAGETLALGDAVCIKASDGYAYEADANDSDLRPCVGRIKKGGDAGDKVEVVVIGRLAGQTKASPGARVYLSETAGEVTTTAPTNPQIIGWVLEGETAGAATSTNYFIFVRPDPSAGAAY